MPVESRRKTEVLQIRLEPPLKAALTEAAAKDERTVTVFVTRLIRDELKRLGITEKASPPTPTPRARRRSVS